MISDTFGRPWRRGVTDVAIGCAGIAAVIDLRGTSDSFGHELMVTGGRRSRRNRCCGHLVMGKAKRNRAAAIVRGLPEDWFRPSSVVAEIVRSPAEDLFR